MDDLPRGIEMRSMSTSATYPDSFTGALRENARPIGHEVTLHNVRTYVSRGSARTNSTIVFLTDEYGFNFINNKLLADQYAAKTGFRVLLPDTLPGGGVPFITMRWAQTVTTPVDWWNLSGHLRRVWASLSLKRITIPFNYRIRRLFPSVLRYVRAVRASLPLGAKLGIAGFCLGGHWSAKICAEPAIEDGDTALIDAHFSAHPVSVTVDEYVRSAARFQVPFSLALGDRDTMMPARQAVHVERNLRRVYADHPERLEVIVHPNCGQGFASRTDPNKTHENESAERALQQAIVLFSRFLQ